VNTVVTAHVSVPVEVDRVGDPVGEPAEFDIENVWVGWESSEEVNEFRESTVSNTILWIPADAPTIPNTATIRFNESDWMVDGKTGASVHPMSGFQFGRKPVPVKEA
jgi:hypothetical protein